MVDFELKERAEDQLSKELFNIIRNQGSRFSESKRIQNLEEANEYLNHQFDRLRRYAQAGDWAKFDYLSDTLLKSSKVFLIYAMDHVLQSHPGMRATKVVKIVESVIKAHREEKNTLNYKRVWIDKKPGDFGRPLGVPEILDRIQDHMMTRVIEAYLCGTDQYSNDQHGGTPGRGTLTFIKELAKRLKTAERVYEFDIKGYFDHIKHDSILEMFESKVIIEYLVGVLKSKPTSYKLPPVEQDEVAIQYQEMMDGDWSYEDDTRSMIANMVRAMPLEEQMLYLENEMARKNKVVHPEGDFDHYFHSEEELLPLMKILEGNPELTLEPHNLTDHITGLEHHYKNIKNQDPLEFMKSNSTYGVELMRPTFTESEREQGRDGWKDLNLEGQGIPQGSSIGPVLSSVLLGKILKPFNGLYYMDDGIIFLKRRISRKEDWNRKMNERLSRIGCEISPEKSRTLRTLDLMTQGLKIVGTRWIQVRQFFHYTVSSETRAGIKRKLFPDIKDNYLQILVELYNKGQLSPSKHKMLRWYLDTNGTIRAVRESDLFKVSEKLGILGNILQKAYSPVTTLEEMKEQIEYGIFKADLKMKSATGSLGERIISHSRLILLETTEGRAEVKPTIFNVRAITNDVLLRYFKGELPARSLRVQGLRKVRKPDSSIRKRGKTTK